MGAMGAGFGARKRASGGVLENFGGVGNDFRVWRGRFDWEIHPCAGYGNLFRLNFGLSGRGIGGLNGVLRFEANFGIFPFFLGFYKLGFGAFEK
jgi:hypothetical protein